MSSPGCRRISVEWDIQDFEMFPKCHSTFPHSLQKRETPFHSKSRFSGFKFIAVSWPPPQSYRKFMVLGKFLAWQRNRERCFSSYHEHGPKKKLRVSMRNRTPDLRIPRSDVLTLSHRDSMASKAHQKVHIWHPLPPAINNVCSLLQLIFPVQFSF